MNEYVKVVLDLIMNPEVIEMLGVIIIALLIKSKIITETEIAKAKKILKKGKATISDVTDMTKLTVSQVEQVVGDSNSKKIQRVARKLLRGWLKY